MPGMRLRLLARSCPRFTLRSERRNRKQGKKGLLVAGFRPPRPRLSGVPFRLFRNAKRKIYMRLSGSSRPGTGFPASHAPHMALALVGQAGLEPATSAYVYAATLPSELLSHIAGLSRLPSYIDTHRPAFTDGTSPSIPRGLQPWVSREDLAILW